jgi:hypothetical protein
VNTPSTAVSPGLGGFLAFFVLAIALWLLMRNMNARMRRMSYRAQQEEEAARREADQHGSDGGPSGLRSEQDAPREEGPRADGDPSAGDDARPTGDAERRGDAERGGAAGSIIDGSGDTGGQRR